VPLLFSNEEKGVNGMQDLFPLFIFSFAPCFQLFGCLGCVIHVFFFFSGDKDDVSEKKQENQSDRSRHFV
jgi:hypothetical protein